MGSFESFNSLKTAQTHQALSAWHRELHAHSENEFRELRLRNKTAEHATSDALVYVRKDFDASKPINIVVYNHGFGSTAGGALSKSEIRTMMSNARPNTVFIAPEWQSHPGTRNGDSGSFGRENKFSHMLDEILQKTPALHGTTLRDVARIDIIAHSAGYAPTESEIYKNPGISGKVRSITLLDSLYEKHAFDRWLADNINDLSTGRKQFFNISNTSTLKNSQEQASLVAHLLRHKRLSPHNYVADYGSTRHQVERHSDEMANRSIVFASTTTEHLAIPSAYIGPTITALKTDRA